MTPTSGPKESAAIAPTNVSKGITPKQKLIIASLVFAVALAARLFASTRFPFLADEAVQGIAALDLLQHGKFELFYPGQTYGGMLEILVQAPLQGLDPGNPTLLRLPIQLLNSATCGLFALLILSVLRSRAAGFFAGLLAAIAPTSFVIMGSFYGPGYASGTFFAMAGLCLMVPFFERPAVRLGIAPAVLFFLAGYSQPIVLMLVLPALVLILTVRTPSIWRSEASAALRGKFGALLLPRLMLVLTPLMVSVIGQKIMSNVQSAAGTTLDPTDTAFEALRSVEVALGLGSWPSEARGLYPWDFNSSMTWVMFDLNHVSRAFATFTSAALWSAVLVGTAAFIMFLFVREPTARIAKLGAVALALLCLGVLVAVYSWALPSYGRYGYAGTYVALAAVVLLVSCLPNRASAVVGASVLFLVLILLIGDLFPMSSNRFDDELITPAAASVREGDSVVGDYWQVYLTQFLRANTISALPLQANRFPEDLAGLTPGGRTTVTMLMPLDSSPVQPVAQTVLRACRKLSLKVVDGQQVFVLDCPNSVLRASAARAYR